MIMSHEEQQLPAPNTTESSSTPISLRQQQTSTLLDHHKQSNPTLHPHQDAPAQAEATYSRLQQQPHQTLPSPNSTMAMHNFGPNPLQQEHHQQLKHTTTNNVNDTSWHSNTNDNPSDTRQSLTISNTITSNNNNNNNNNNNSKNNDNDTNQKLPQTENSLTTENRPLNRQPHHQPHSQSQQYHGIFSPQIPASLQTSLASRVDQIIRTTLHDSPAYTPPTSKNSNNNNNSCVPNNTTSSNMSSPSSSSSLVFNPASNMMSTPVSSAPLNIPGHPQSANTGPIPSTTSSLNQIYGPSSLSAMGDMSTNNGANSIASPKTSAHSSASHSALAAAAALQSLNQSHVQRSQQQLAHTQQAPFLNAAPLTTTKPPSNSNGTPVPQAAHGNSGNNSSNHMPKLCITTSMANSDLHKHPFTSENVGDFASRPHPNNAMSTANSNKMSSQPPTLAHLQATNWQEHMSHTNGIMPRMTPSHGVNTTIPSFTPPQGPYGLLPMGLNVSNSNNMIGQDGDSTRLNALRNSTSNSLQPHDDKIFQQNLGNALAKHSPLTLFDGLRGPQTGLSTNDARLAPQHNVPEVNERVTEEKLAIFAYNLLSAGIPGSNRCKKIIHLDDDMRDSIQNGEFYTKYDHVATGILTNTILLPNFSIIDYLRRDRFSFQELERIERVNRKLSVSNFACLMELVRQRPLISSANKPPSEAELAKPTFTDSMPINIGPNMSFQQESIMGAPQNTSYRSPFMSSSPNRHDSNGPHGIDKSCRSSQSPSDITRSQVGSNNNNSKFMNAQNPFPSIHLNPPHSSPSTNSHQLVPSPYSMSQKIHPQHISPRANRSSPFQQPVSISTQMMTRPTRSHSTIGNSNIGAFNAPFISSPLLQPPAAHQSSSRPNLAALNSEVLPSHAHSGNVPVTAHMSSKTPQTPRLIDGLSSVPPPLSKTSPSSLLPNKSPSSKDLINHNQVDYPFQSGRQDIDSIHDLPIQTLLNLRQQEINNRELAAKRSIAPHYAPPGVPNAFQIENLSNAEMTRHGSIENQFSMQQSHNSHQQLTSQNNNPLGLANISAHRNSNLQGFTFNSPFNLPMPPPPASSSANDYQSLSHRDVNRHLAPPHVSTTNSTAPDQYSAMVTAYQQQQILLSNKLIDNGPGALPPSNTNNRLSSQSSTTGQSTSHRPAVSEPMLVDTHLARQPQSQTNSPKSNNQRSIITGSASTTGSKKGKKAKISPTTTAQPTEDKKPDTSYDMAAELIAPKCTPIDRPELPIDIAASAGLETQSTIACPTSGGTQSSELTDAHAASTITKHPENSARDILMNVKQENCHDTSAGKLETISANSTVLNTSDQSITCDQKSPNDSSLTELETKSFTSSTDVSLQNSSSLSQPSKYLNIFTKKAWLKTYDEEDQARISTEASNAADNMVVKTTTSKEPELQGNVEDDAPGLISATNEKSSALVSKSNGSSKNGRSSKSDAKKKVKEAKANKANSVAALRPSRVAPKVADNDSEGTTASISDLDDTDETDSMKSSSDKKLRRMPRRKVKSNPDRESTDQSVREVKPKISKESKDKEATRKRGKKDIMAPEVASVKRKYNSDDESVKNKTKKAKDMVTDNVDLLSPKNKKKVGDKFLQTQPCYEIVPKAIRCLECRRVRQSSTKADKTTQPKQVSKANWDDFCRFFAFRKLRYNKASQIVVAGFSESLDAKESDKLLWLPGKELPTNITYKVAKFILENIGDEFCNMVLQERSVIKAYEAKSGDKRTTWKRAVNGLRELCDVCSTTLFNCHYVCERCGFVICIDCHKFKSDNHKAIKVEDDIKKESGDSGDSSHDVVDQPVTANRKSKKDACGWIFCAKNEEHSHDKLALAKIIAGDCLEEVWTLLHEKRQQLRLGHCACTKTSMSAAGEWNLDKASSANSIAPHETGTENEGSHSTLKGLLLATTNSPVHEPPVVDDNASDSDQILTTKKAEANENEVFDFANDDDSQDDSRQVSAAIEGCIASLNIEGQYDALETTSQTTTADVQDKTHLKLCDGDLLVLTHSRHKENTRLFREHWRQGKPVLVRDIHRRMNIDMWLPQFFSGKFGDYRSDLVDCRNGDIHRQSMRKYWDGFEPNPAKKRAKDENSVGHIPSATNEEPNAIATSYYSGSALWRLKDWPPGQDFKEILPEHYEDFMNNLPLSSYTTRSGRLNLACRLPKEMVKPDLGPKMYSAYGTNKFPERGTTNLHLDISDAVNVMVYVGGATPYNQGSVEYGESYDKTVDECCIDAAMKAQIKEHNLIPGALWHIFRPSDVHKMREFLNKVSDECKISHEKRNDPIHDQVWYLDQPLLDRLFKEYGVKSYPILQCMGDAIIIPAGSPHQVKNLQNCIKVANDFVSPENVRYCLQLTNEFRNLPETHINQEDKLQIKNILYHSVKESIQYIDMFESGQITASDEPSDEDD